MSQTGPCHDQGTRKVAYVPAYGSAIWVHHHNEQIAQRTLRSRADSRWSSHSYSTVVPFLEIPLHYKESSISQFSLWSTPMFQFYSNAFHLGREAQIRSSGQSLCPSDLTVWMWKKTTLNNNTSFTRACIRAKWQELTVRG